MKSIRRALTNGVLIGVVVTTALSGFAIFFEMKRTLVSDFDAAQLGKARALSALLELDDEGLEFKLTPGSMPEFSRAADPEYFEIRLADGTPVERALSLGDGHLAMDAAPSGSPAFDMRLPDGRAGRGVAIDATIEQQLDDDDGAQPPNPQAQLAKLEVQIVLARGRASLDATLAAVRNTCALAYSALLLAILFLVPRIVRRGLRPLEALGNQVGSIDAASLSKRIPSTDLPLELRIPAEKLNELLARLEAAFDRERRMTANIAHELRTPIAELKTAVEIAQRWPNDAELATSAIDTGSAIAKRMSELVSGLLRLARIESGAALLALEDVELCGFVDEIFENNRATAAIRGLTFSNEMSSEILLRTDRTLLTMAITNLVDNAVRFSTEGTTISCESRGEDHGAFTFVLRNHTSSLSHDDLARLTEAFWQKDAARTDGRHAGLGLTLVNSIARVLDFELEFALNQEFEVLIKGRRGTPRGALSLR